MGLAKLPYTYEYLGTNIGTLVRTELTDQCFLTLTQVCTHLYRKFSSYVKKNHNKSRFI